MLCKLCGDAALKNVVIITNMWTEISPSIGEAREKDLSSEFFKPALDKGARMVQHHDTIESAHGIIRMIVANRPVPLRIQWQLADKGKVIVDTAAGKVITQELNEQVGRHQTELKKVREEMVEASKDGDEETVDELEEDGRKMEERVEKIKKDLEGMVTNYAAERERMEAKVKEMEQKTKRRRERTEAEGKRQLTDRQRLEQEVGRPQDVVEIPVTILADDPAHLDAPTRTGETERAKRYENRPPPIPPRIPSPQVTTLVTSYVQALFV